jgi:hypothetical protein
MKKRLIIRKAHLKVVPFCGKFKGKLVSLLKRGFSGWHGKLDSGEIVYVFSDEIREEATGR